MSRLDKEGPALDTCPFCQSGAHYFFDDTACYHGSYGTYYAACDECGARVYGGRDKESAAMKWNQRVPDPTSTRTLDKLISVNRGLLKIIGQIRRRRGLTDSQLVCLRQLQLMRKEAENDHTDNSGR